MSKKYRDEKEEGGRREEVIMLYEKEKNEKETRMM
jgi:hypothetical protein